MRKKSDKVNQQQAVPELLGPAGDKDCLRAALAGGADAVYFGLASGFNARARAANIELNDLPEIMEQIHACGAQAYITLNTLVFESELSRLESILRAVGEAGADGIIVQDPAVAWKAREICPRVHVHASTQMTISHPAGGELVRSLGMVRVVLPREFSLKDVEIFRQESSLDTEVFILGALCISFSGQCLASLSWGGRSANRGMCAQACRLPYKVIVDGQESKSAEFVFNARDLAGFASVDELQRLGVKSLKIEGRLKSPNYVYTACRTMREWLDSLGVQGHRQEGAARTNLERNFADLCISYSRGFGPGWLAGLDHSRFINPVTPKHRGLFLGRVEGVRGRTVSISPQGSNTYIRDRRSDGDKLDDEGGRFSVPDTYPVLPQKGMGALIITGAGSAAGGVGATNVGGPIYDVAQDRGVYKITFGQKGPDLSRVRPGDEVYITSSPAVSGRTDAAMRSPLVGRFPLELKLSGKVGTPLRLEAIASGCRVSLESEAKLTCAENKGLDRETLLEKLGALGGTPFKLRRFDTKGLDLAAGLFLPASQLKPLRRDLIASLEKARAQADRGPVSLQQKPASPRWAPQPALLASYREPDSQECLEEQGRLSVLCRRVGQVRACLRSGAVSRLMLEGLTFDDLREMHAACLEANIRPVIALPRLPKPGEEKYIESLARWENSGLLVRSLGTLGVLRAWGGDYRHRLWHGDFSLNAVNSVSARWLMDQGLDTLTLGEDAHLQDICDMAQAMGEAASRLEVLAYRHIPVFYTQHCLYAQRIAGCADSSECGRACRKHSLQVRDRLGHVHEVRTDLACRNLVFDESPTVLPVEHLDYLRSSGVGALRLDFLDEDYRQCLEILQKFASWC